MPIIPHLSGILHLSLFYVPGSDESKQITDKSVHLLATHCVALKELHIHHNVNITDDSIA